MLDTLQAPGDDAASPWIRVTRVDGTVNEGTIVARDAAGISISDPAKLQPVDIAAEEIRTVELRVVNQSVDLSLVGLALIATPAMIIGYVNAYLSRLFFSVVLGLVAVPLVWVLLQRDGPSRLRTKWRLLYRAAE